MKYLFLVLCSIYFISCSSGKIETVEKSAYPCPAGTKMEVLTNTSSSKKLTFTIKVLYNGNTSTDKYTLNPGEQQDLGCLSAGDKTEIVGVLEEE